MASMDMTILGCSGSLAAPDNAASGYLLRMADGRQILMDVGAGVLARLEALGEPGEVDVIFSHLHPDHCSDFGSLVVWQRFHPTSPARHRHILLGPSISAVHLGRAGADHPDLVEDYSDILEIGTWQAPDAEAVPVAFSDESRGTVYPEHRIGETRLYAAPAVHPTESYMIRVEAADGTSLVYSGDTAATGHLAALATGADVLLCEATWGNATTATTHRRCTSPARRPGRRPPRQGWDVWSSRTSRRGGTPRVRCVGHVGSSTARSSWPGPTWWSRWPPSDCCPGGAVGCGPMTASDPLFRADGRAVDQLRDVRITRGFTSNPAGSVLVEFGNTRVMCTASVSEGVPRFKRDSGEGWLTAEYAMLPSATAERMPREAMRGKVKGRTHEISRLVGRSLRAAVDLRGLGENTVNIDCDVLQADGGTRTASITGAYVALADALAVLKARGVVPGQPLLPRSPP